MKLTKEQLKEKMSPSILSADEFWSRFNHKAAYSTTTFLHKKKGCYLVTREEILRIMEAFQEENKGK